MDKTYKKLLRSRRDRIIAGVCGGLGEYFEIDPLIFRIIFLALILGGGFGIVLYLILALVVPSESTFDEINTNGKNEGTKANVNDFADQIRKNTDEIARDLKAARRPSSFRSWLGFFIILFGIIFLLNNLYPIPWVNWSILWPIIIIVLGLLIMVKKGR